MTKLLEKAFAEAANLPEEEQEPSAELVSLHRLLALHAGEVQALQLAQELNVIKPGLMPASEPRHAGGSYKSLFLIELPARIQVVEIQDRVEDEEVTALCLTAPKWVS